MRYIGDIHGDYKTYFNIIEGCERSIQVGDFGIGFVANPVDMYDTSKHEFIRGNHDYPHSCKRWEPNYIPDGTFRPETSTFFCGGALSVDKVTRKYGIDWWDDEELTIKQFYDIIDEYVEAKPKIMVTHDCPEFLARKTMSGYDSYKASIPSTTRQAFDAMWVAHKPKVWIFGHWHESVKEEVNGTTFICLNINEYIDLEV